MNADEILNTIATALTVGKSSIRVRFRDGRVLTLVLRRAVHGDATRIARAINDGGRAQANAPGGIVR